MPTTTYMGMVLPVPASTLGPLWATELNAALTVNDAHDHTTGKGKQVPTAGINVNADLTFGSYNATALKSARFTSQAAPLGGVSDLSTVYVSAGDLYFNNSAGTQIRVTAGGALNVAGLSTNYFTRLAVSTNIVIGPADTNVYYDVDCSGGARAITLPAANAVTAGRFYVFSDTTGSSATNAVTVSRAGADTIDGAASVTLASAHASLMLISDGASKWKTLRFEDRARLNGSTVPAGGALTTGNVLQVSGAAALSYAALNLAGGAGYVTGVLPAANLPDCSTVAKGVVQLGGDLGGSVASQTVIDVTGTGGTAQVKCADFKFPNTVNSPFFGHVAKGSSGAGTHLTVYAQDANTSGNGGDLILVGGLRAGTGYQGRVKLATGSFGGSMMMFVEAAQVSSSQSALFLCGNSVGDATKLPANAGDGVVHLGNAFTAPTAAPASGVVLYAEGGAFGFIGTANKRVKVSGTTNTGASIGNAGPTVPGSCQAWLEIVHNGTTYRVPMFA